MEIINKNPWKSNEKAYCPMFDEDVSIKGKRQDGLEINTTLKCIVFVDETGDPLSESAISTDREDVTITFEPSCWGYVQKLRRGDILFRPFNQKSYSVQSVIQDFVMGWIVKARQI